MNAVGIDVSKGKSTVTVLHPGREVVLPPFDVEHNREGFKRLVTILKKLDGDTKVVMEATGNYYLPVAQYLTSYDFFVSVVNPMLVKDYSSKLLTVRKVKTDSKDALKIAAFALDRWTELVPFCVQPDERSILKTLNRQYDNCNKIKTMLKNNLISVLDQTFPGINKLFTSAAKRSNGREKWVDFVLRYPHSECVSGKSFTIFAKSYCSWCKKNEYHYSERKAKQIYEFACNCIISLPLSNAAKLLVSNIAAQLSGMYEMLALLISQMHSIAQNLPEYDIVMSMYGVGYILGPQLIAEIGDVSRFRKKQALAAFAGVDPQPYQSGNLNPKSHPISKRGSPHLRKALFQVMEAILKNAPANEPVFQFIDKKRKQGKLYRTYMTAGANKFLKIYFARVTEHLKLLRLAA